MVETVYDLIKRKTQDENTSWLADGLIYLVETGSRAYGTHTNKSDRDYKGIVVPPLEYHIGMKTFNSVNISTGNETTKNGVDDIDVTLYSLKYFMQLAVKGNPNLLEMLYVDEENILLDNKELRESNDLFLTKYLARSFGGFGVTLRKDFTKKLDKGIYDGKTVMNLMRIYEMGAEALSTGAMFTKRPNALELLRLRNMTVDVSDASQVENLVKLIDDKKKEFMLAEDTSQLRQKANMKRVEELLIKLTLENVEFKAYTM